MAGTSGEENCHKSYLLLFAIVFCKICLIFGLKLYFYFRFIKKINNFPFHISCIRNKRKEREYYAINIYRLL